MFWHSTSVDRPRVRTLGVSLLVHVAGLALLWTVHSSEPVRVPSTHVIPIALQFHAPKPVTPKHLHQPVPKRAGPFPRTFRVPDRTPAPPTPPQLTLALPPLLHTLEIPPPKVPILELPPAPVRRKLAPTGVFDSAAADSDQAVTRAVITPGAFGDASIAALEPRTNKSSESGNYSPAEILSKPRPAYTDEARRLQIEGEVLLEMLFGASGKARVLRLIRGLGHGLDENAITAALEIRFRPAQRGGAAVDSSAIVHIVFQVAH